ncbi:hypothetical protein C942_04929 [Photobacterium marinum]|uniref:Uncharacterized protein n=1 Tax=Photobacterium marinum TaxID=1056511 RepID=L8JFT4_9GAMM|nr:hypothetical protein C942_04929 [Photobacterium marinum]
MVQVLAFCTIMDRSGVSIVLCSSLHFFNLYGVAHNPCAPLVVLIVYKSVN